MVSSFTRSGKSFKAVLISKIPYKKNKKNILFNKVIDVVEDNIIISDDKNNESSVSVGMNNNIYDDRKDDDLDKDGDDSRNNTIDGIKNEHSKNNHKQDVVERALNFNNEEEYSACRLLLDAANTLPPLSSFSYEIESLSDTYFDIDDNNDNDLYFSKVTDSVFDYDDKYIEQDYDHTALRDSSLYYDTIKALSILHNKDDNGHHEKNNDDHNNGHNVDHTAILHNGNQSADIINTRKLEKTPQVSAANYNIVTVLHNNGSDNNNDNNDNNNNNNNSSRRSISNNNSDNDNDNNSGTNKKELTERQILQIQLNKKYALIKLRMKQNKINALLKLQSKNKIKTSSTINNIDHQSNNNSTTVNFINESSNVTDHDHKKIMLPSSSSSSLLSSLVQQSSSSFGSQINSIKHSHTIVTTSSSSSSSSSSSNTIHELTESQLIKIDKNRRAALLKLQMIQGKNCLR